MFHFRKFRKIKELSASSDKTDLSFVANEVEN